jgi:hypothetical protein
MVHTTGKASSIDFVVAKLVRGGGENLRGWMANVSSAFLGLRAPL